MGIAHRTGFRTVVTCVAASRPSLRRSGPGRAGTGRRHFPSPDLPLAYFGMGGSGSARAVGPAARKRLPRYEHKSLVSADHPSYYYQHI